MKHIILFLCLVLSSSVYAEKKLDNEQLKLMYDSFIFSKDLKHAYKLAKKALKIYPDSIYWHQKMGEVALWRGLNSEAMKHLIFVYKRTNDEKLGEEIIKKMLATYQYKKAKPLIDKRVITHYDKHAINSMIDINDKIGRPEKSLRTLKKLYEKKHSLSLLVSMLKISLDIGDIKEASNVVKSIEKYKRQSVDSALELSRYYILKKKLNKAYGVLLSVKSKADKNDVKYFEQLSDLGWYLHDYDNAVYGSMMLYMANRARVSDYERIELMYKQKDIEVLKGIAIDAIKRHQNKKYILNYITQALKKGDYSSVNFLIYDELGSSSSILKNDPKFWLFKAEVDKHYKKDKRVKEDLQRAISLNVDSSDIINSTLWALIDGSHYKFLSKYVKKLESQKKVEDSAISHALSAAYLTLQKPDKAMYYLKIAQKENRENLDLQFLETEILATQGKEKQRKERLRQILKNLKIAKQKRPNLSKDKRFLRQYLQASMEFVDKKKWRELFDSSKKYLSKKDFYELKILHALKYKEYKKAESYYKESGLDDPQLEVELAHALHKNIEKERLIKKYKEGIPRYILIEHDESIDNIDDAIKIAKNASKDNRSNLYFKNRLDYLYNNYTSYYEMGVNFSKRSFLKNRSFHLNNFYYFFKGYGLITNIENHRYKSTNLREFNLKDSNKEWYIYNGVRKTTVNGRYEIGFIFRDSIKRDLGFVIEAYQSYNDYLQFSAKIENSIRVDDQSIVMKVGGKQNRYTIETSYSYDAKKQLSCIVEYDKYFSQDDFYLGDGKRANFIFDYMFDYKYTGARVFYNIGKFDENFKKGNILDLLRPEQQFDKLLQNDYQDSGFGFYYGNQDKIFGKRFSPYIDINGIYSSKEKRFYTFTQAGVMGALTKVDLLHLGVKYQNAFNGIEQEEFNLFLDYTREY